MSRIARTAPAFEQVLREVGLIAKWEAQGQVMGKETITRNFLKKGMPIDEIVQVTELPVETLIFFLLSHNIFHQFQYR